MDIEVIKNTLSNVGGYIYDKCMFAKKINTSVMACAMCIHVFSVYIVAPLLGSLYGDVFEDKIAAFIHLFTVAILLLCTVLMATLAIITRFKYSVKTIFIAITHGTFYFLILLILWNL